MDLNLTDILAGLAVILLLIYYFSTKNFDTWRKQNVTGPKPIPFFGNYVDTYFGKTDEDDMVLRYYNEFPNEPVVGTFVGTKPTLILKDPDIIQDVLIKSFTTFSDRGFKLHKNFDPLACHILYMPSESWRPMRKRLSPTFTTNKLRDMFYLISECAEHLVTHLDELVKKKDVIECRELSAKYTTDVIGVCAYGLNMHTLSDQESEFRRYCKKMLKRSWQNMLRHWIRHQPAWVVKLLMPLKDNRTINFFVNMMSETIEYRKKNNVRRNDFIDLLADIQNLPETIGENEFSMESLTAQAFIFFVAGFETTSAAMSHALYELALNPQMQSKLRKEINETIQQNDGKLTYDALKNMKYFDKVLKETLRKYPSLVISRRVAGQDHTFSGTKISVPKEAQVFIPIYAIHNDPSIYPQPEKFDPERHSEEAVASRHPMHYLPFLDGPRNCIGKRFANIQTKMGLASLLHNFSFDVCENTCQTYVKKFAALILTPKEGIWLKVKKL